MKYCPNCNLEHEDTELFCFSCGVELQEVQPTPHERNDKPQASPPSTVVAVAEVTCPHCNKDLTIAKRPSYTKTAYDCTHCRMGFNYSGGFHYDCPKCLGVVKVEGTVAVDKSTCPNCETTYDLEYRVFWGEENKTEKEGHQVPKFPFAILLVMGFVALLVGVFSYDSVAVEFNQEIPSALVTNWFSMVVVGIILWGLATILLGLLVPEARVELIKVEGVSILVLGTLITLFMSFVHDNPQQYSYDMWWILILLYAGWIVARLLFLGCARSSGDGVHGTDIYFSLCICSSCDECAYCCGEEECCSDCCSECDIADC